LQEFARALGWTVLLRVSADHSGPREAPRGKRRQERGDDLELQILLVPVAIRPSLEHTDLVVEPLDHAQADLVLGLAVGGDAVPVALDHRCELLVGLESLPLERVAATLEERSRPAFFALVVPELAELLLENIRRVESPVRSEQFLQFRLWRPSQERFSHRQSRV
jgi:hypothetical protein